ncbi:hypothetical protein BDV96DRAFT_629123 [Lophiotrema nucula]|uniref:Uncharacterized protein n=1 Tax=Lophiotrema nucula TaxID=690887 RepID=A0A6A5ZKM0_9PLEO|nr:hypothetical protein BDV96DRAFT_629123 [Lophiotrema nucula]
MTVNYLATSGSYFTSSAMLLTRASTPPILARAIPFKTAPSIVILKADAWASGLPGSLANVQHSNQGFTLENTQDDGADNVKVNKPTNEKLEMKIEELVDNMITEDLGCQAGDCKVLYDVAVDPPKKIAAPIKPDAKTYTLEKVIQFMNNFGHYDEEDDFSRQKISESVHDLFTYMNNENRKGELIDGWMPRCGNETQENLKKLLLYKDTEEEIPSILVPSDRPFPTSIVQDTYMWIIFDPDEVSLLTPETTIIPDLRT